MYRIPQFSGSLHIYPLAMLFGTVYSHEPVCKGGKVNTSITGCAIFYRSREKRR
ncbi:MAG: hypothetical protein ACTSUT_18980 [Promethearchaeota archaeon]